MSPLDGAAIDRSSDATAGVEEILNERVADQAVFAGTPGAESPWVESTRQNLVPAVSDVTVQLGPVI